MEKLMNNSLVSYYDLMVDGKFVEYLDARYDSRASFYKKAKIYELDGIIYLVSYTTIVAKIHENYAQVLGWYSQTTSRHINEFLKQNGFRTLTKSEMNNGGNIQGLYGVIIERR